MEKPRIQNNCLFLYRMRSFFFKEDPAIIISQNYANFLVSNETCGSCAGAVVHFWLSIQNMRRFLTKSMLYITRQFDHTRNRDESSETQNHIVPVELFQNFSIILRNFHLIFVRCN